MTAGLVVALCLLATVSIVLWRRQVAYLRESHIRDFELPRGLFEQLRKRRPALTAKDCQLVAQGLRQYFLAYLKSGCRYVSMPSQVADELWHEFILNTRAYQEFCGRAFGGFFHHTPAAALGKNRVTNAGLRRCFWFACRAENINPLRPSRLPLLFALDAKLNIADGFRYAVDCSKLRRQEEGDDSLPTYCGGDFGSSSFDGTTDGFGDIGGGSWGDGSAGGGADAAGSDGGSCGGGGCGGGGGD